MTTETVNLQELQQSVHLILEKVMKLEQNIEEINDDLHQVRPEYLHKLNQIKKGKSLQFKDKSTFLHFLHHEL